MKLENWTGSELFASDLARGLLKAGHRPVLYSPRLGRLAEEIRMETVPVVDDLRKLSAEPDIIHGQHANETLTALLHFPRSPALYFCHDWYFAEDYPPRFPRVLRYVAADDQCYDKLVCEFAVPEEKAQVMCQFVDLKKFVPRAALPERPRRAAILCHHTKENEYLRAVREACTRKGIKLDVYGLSVGRTCERPEEVMRDYDVVFAKGRTALEAAAVGAAVIVYWWRRLGPMVRPNDLDELKATGFGVRSMGPQLTPDEFGRAIERALDDYDPAATAEVSRRVRAEAGSDASIAELLRLYEEVIVEHAAAPPADRELESRAASAHLRDVSVAFSREREALFNLTPFRVAKRLERTPVFGRLSRVLARGLAGGQNGKE